MSTAAPPAPAIPQTPPFLRHALGMPAGSVRAMLALFILGYLWIMALSPDKLQKQPNAATAFAYTQLVMVLVLCHFTVAHGKTIGGQSSRHSPLWLPRGVIRLLLLGGYFGLAYYTFKIWGERKDSIDIETIIIVMAVVLAAFLAGHFSSGVMSWLSGGPIPFWFQDVQAWFGLVGVLLLLFVLIVRLVVNPTIQEDKNLVTLKFSEPAMVSFVAFYFGARS